MLRQFNKFLNRFERTVNLEFLKEEFRKAGTNFVTAAIVALFINHITHPTFWICFGSGWLILVGALSLFFGILR